MPTAFSRSISSRSVIRLAVGVEILPVAALALAGDAGEGLIVDEAQHGAD